MPLDIVGLPFYEKLDDKEKELCSVARIAPKAYFEFRALLEKEYKTYGSLKLAQARSLISIDVYAPNEDAHDNEKDSFYEELNSTIKEHKKSRDQLIIMGDFNAKVGAGKEQQIIGPYGIGIRNENGEKLVDFCKQQKLIATNTWFEQKESSRHTWISPDGNTKNQLDYILLSERYRNSAKNSKARPGADCGSDHNPVVLKLKTTMKKLKSKQMGLHWNTEKLKEDKVRGEFREQIERKLGEVCTKEMSSEVLWNKFKKDIHEVAHQSCGRNNPEKKQPWITVEILNLMIERRKLKNPKNSKNNIRYKQMCRNIQKSCREAKETYYRDKCEELEELDAKHSPKLYVKIKELQQKKPRIKLGLRNKEGVVLQEDDDIKKRWHEYVKQLYSDRREEEYILKSKEEVEVNITEEEVEETIKMLPKRKATGVDEIPAEFLQSCGPHGIKVITAIINKIYRTGELPIDFLTNVFIPIPKIAKAMKCEDHRTISLISHASKILLYIIKKRITPFIERNLTESQFGFRKDRGTRNAIHLLRILGERMIEKKKDLFVCYIDYSKACSRNIQLELQKMISRIHEMCTKYGMSINIKKTKVMVVRKKKEQHTQGIKITVDGQKLEHVKEYTYLGSVVNENAKCLIEVRKRIGMAKTSFWKCKEFLRRDLALTLKKRLLDCYVKSVAAYGCEAWTFSKEITARINALQLWCYRRMLKVKYTDHVTNKKVKERIGAEKIQWAEDLARRKLKFAGHVMRGRCETLTQLVLEGLVEGKRDRGEFGETT
ncbi:Craniofacial development protein 2 [Nymphon striatum]|nr:Craniofacial development protein 2 [Nymphon striatum]